MKLANKKILIIGGSGSLGHALVERLCSSNEVIVMSRDETKQWMMKNRFQGKEVHYSLCDIRNCEALRRSLVNLRPHIIINASAMKQVPSCESFPSESVLTNILGVQNLVDLCQRDIEPEIVLGVSTDKACKPVNVYGMCKAVGERIFTSAPESKATRFLCVRYGNVLESRGSIIPLFKYRARTDKVYTVTARDMTRFFITLDESVDLILSALVFGKHGDILVPLLRSGKIEDLADIFIDQYGGKKSFIGIRPGEKVHEELVGEEELRLTFEFNKQYLVLKPMRETEFTQNDLTYGLEKSALTPTSLTRFTSDLFLYSRDELQQYLKEKRVLESDYRTFQEDEVKF
jgi:UDP-N-acetylglucosamine 4,6-dehydratase/5-epimerase